MATLMPADPHLHKRREPSFGRVRPFADQGPLLLERLQVEAGQGQESNAFRAADPLLADDLVEMAGGASQLERRHGHEPLVLAAVVTGRAGSGNGPCRILLRHFREVLAEVAGMVVDDPCAPPERIVLEFRVMAVEAVELHYVAGAALLVGDFIQIEIDALMLLVAGRAGEAVCDHVVCREGDTLSTGRMRYWRLGSDFYQPLGALLQHLGRSAVRVEGRIRHFVTRETGPAVGQRLASDEAVNPAQFATPAVAVAGAAILDRAVSARQRSRHQELNVLAEKEGGAERDDGRKRQQQRQTVAPGAGGRLPLRSRWPNRSGLDRSPHHRSPDEKA